MLNSIIKINNLSKHYQVDKTKIVLIYPRGGDIKRGIPLAFGYLKSNADADKYDIKIIDCTLDDIDPSSPDFIVRIKQISPDVVGTSSWSVNFPEALMILKTVKQIDPNITTIFGGPHATVFAEKVIKNEEIDFVFRGEAELSFPVFLDEFNKKNPNFSKVKGLVYQNEKGETIFSEIARIENPDDVKIPDYSAINLERYIEKGYRYNNSKERNAPIWATRGCPYRCAFCSVPSINGRKIRKHSIEYMIRWIKFLYKKHNIRGFVIIDDNFTFDIEYAKAFCRGVIKLGYKDIEFNCPNGIRMQRGNYELWSLMRQAGWCTIVVAPESGSKRVLQSLRKDLDPEEVPNIVKDIKKAKLKVHGFFMVGCPGETKEDLKETELLIKRCKFNGLSITNFQPMPGTLIYDELIKRGEIVSDFLPAFFRKRVYVPSTLRDFDLEKFVSRVIETNHAENIWDNIFKNMGFTPPRILGGFWKMVYLCFVFSEPRIRKIIPRRLKDWIIKHFA